MAKIRSRKENGRLYLDFFFQGRRCREQTMLEDSPSNRKRLEKLLVRIDADINAGTFDYVRYFPNSKRAAQFATDAAGVATNKVSAAVFSVVSSVATMPSV